jgi:hypothetical protein
LLSPTLSDLGFIDTCTAADYARMEEEKQQQQQPEPGVDADLAGMTFEQRLALLCDDDSSSDGEQGLGMKATADVTASLDAGSCAGSAAGDDEQQEDAMTAAASAAAVLPVDSTSPTAAAVPQVVQEASSSSSSRSRSVGSAAGPSEVAADVAGDAEEQQQVCRTPLLPAHLASRATQTSPAVADAAAQVGPEYIISPCTDAMCAYVPSAAAKMPCRGVGLV